MDVQVPLTDLGQNTDEPRLPERFHDLIEIGASMDEYGKTDDTRYAVMDREYRQLMGELQYWIAVQQMSAPQVQKASQLGPWFPSGS